MVKRVLIADDHTIVRQSLVKLISADPGLEVVGEAANGFYAVQLVHHLRPDLVLMDLYMPGLDGVAATRHIKEAGSSSAVVVLTASGLETDILAAVKAGAKGYILKTSDPDSFLAQVHRAASGYSHFPPEITVKLVAGLATEQPDSPLDAHEFPETLTRREEQVLELIAQGLTNQQIAEALVISQNTARVYVRNLMQKFHENSRTALAIRALHNGFPGLARNSSPAVP